MSKDTRAKALVVALGISYTRALHLVREYCAKLDGPMTSQEIVTNIIREYQLREAVDTGDKGDKR